MPVREQPPGVALSSSSSTTTVQQQPIGTSQEGSGSSGQQVASSGNSNMGAISVEPTQASSGLTNISQQQDHSQVAVASGVPLGSNNNSMPVTSSSSGLTTTTSSATSTTFAATSSSALKYMVMAGTAEKMLGKYSSILTHLFFSLLLEQKLRFLYLN